MSEGRLSDEELGRARTRIRLGGNLLLAAGGLNSFAALAMAMASLTFLPRESDREPSTTGMAIWIAAVLFVGTQATLLLLSGWRLRRFEAGRLIYVTAWVAVVPFCCLLPLGFLAPWGLLNLLLSGTGIYLATRDATMETLAEHNAEDGLFGKRWDTDAVGPE